MARRSSKPGRPGSKPGAAPRTSRASRAAQARRGKALDRLDPEAWRRALLADEQGTIFGDGRVRVGLCYPNPYRVAMSSLGYQVVYRTINEHPELAAERVVLPDDVADYRRRGLHPVSLEQGRPLGDFDLLAFSVAYDLDLLGFFDLLDLGGVPALRSERRDTDPPVLLGGPVTASNPLPFAPFIDLCVVGDAEQALPPLLEALAEATSRQGWLEAAARIPGVWVPEIHGDAVPATQKVTVGLPAIGQITTPHTELSDMFLVEASRGCPRFCKFCLVRSPESPMRQSEVARVVDAIPEHATRVGFVGAAISEWDGIREALRVVTDRGLGVGISSLRADRLDDEFVGLMRKGGYRAMTVASDAASQRLRGKMAKGLRDKHLVNAAALAKAHGMARLKLYLVIGLPGETDADLDELVRFTKTLRGYLPVALGVSPLVPKLHTPLGDAPFAGIREVDRRLTRLKRELGGVAELRSTSAKWAWVEYRLSQGAEDAGLAAYEAWKQGGRFAHFKRAFDDADERGGLIAAQRHGLFAAAGMR